MQQRAGDNAARGSHFNKHTVAARAGGSHQRCSFPRQPPPPSYTHTHPNIHTHTPSHYNYHHSDSAFNHLRPTIMVSPACQSRSRSPPLSPTSIMRDMGVSSEQRRGKEPQCDPPLSITPPGCDQAGGLPHAQGNYHTSFVAKCTGE